MFPSFHLDAFLSDVSGLVSGPGKKRALGKEGLEGMDWDFRYICFFL
jgi:hypothetical protein